MIRDAAAMALARKLVDSMMPGADESIVQITASLIVNAVALDEKQQECERIDAEIAHATKSAVPPSSVISWPRSQPR